MAYIVVPPPTHCPYLDHHLLFNPLKIKTSFLERTVSHLGFLFSIYLYQHQNFEYYSTDHLTLSLKSNIYSRKDILHNYIEFAEKCPKKSDIGKITLNLASNC